MVSALFDEVLDDFGAQTRQMIAEYLPAGKPDRYLYEPIADYPGRGGKMMRPAICMSAARVFGATTDAAVRIATSIELLHNALLIHDDIEDESETRRGAPTLHIKYGVPIALNAGDALALASLRPLSDLMPDVGPWLGMALIREMDRMARESAEGQAIELGWRRDNVIDLCPDDYLLMVLKKTSWLATIYPCRTGAMLGLRSEIDTAAFVRFGFLIGAAFQINDDILNIEADDRYGKEICGDLLEGKRTLMLIDLLHRLEGRDQQRLIHALSVPREEQSMEDVAWMRKRIIEDGCLDRAKAAAQGLVGAALHEFSLAFGDRPDSREKTFLSELAAWTMERRT